MELAKVTDKSNGLMHAITSSVEQRSPELADAALARIRGWKDIEPLGDVVTVQHAQDCEKLLEGASKISLESRQRAKSVVIFMSDVENRCKSRTKMCDELGFNLANLSAIEYWWPGFWPFVSLISVSYLHEANWARVVQSTVDAAVHGTHQDRRLYMEAFRGLKQRGEGRGNTFVFVNDSVRRPEPQSVEAEVIAVERLTEGEEV